MNILVRAPNWIGDQVLAYPFFHFLRTTYPQARIVCACASWVAAIQFQNLVDDVIVLPKPASRSFQDRFRALEAGAAIAKLKGPWDLGISLPNSFSAAWLLYRAGCVRRRGFKGDARSFLLTERLDSKDALGVHRAETYVSLLTELKQDPKVSAKKIQEFWGVPPKDDLDPGVKGVIPEFPVEKAWPGIAPLEPPQEAYWVLAPGSVAESRRWPIEKFFQLAEIVYAETQLPVVIVGGPAEKPLAQKFMELVKEAPTHTQMKVYDLCGQGSVSSLWKVFRRARFAIANDSGLAHVASLCGCPIQVIWGAGDPKRTAPMGPGPVKIKFHVVDCWPCERNVCYKTGAEKVACLYGIDPVEVWQEMQSYFKK